MKTLATICATAALILAANSAAWAVAYDQNVTPDVIFGAGNDNGSFTVGTGSGVEIGMRGKLRHNAAGAPENTFNSNGDGTYTFQAGVAPTQAFPTAVWSVEWAINTNFDGTGDVLQHFRYEMGVDSDPTAGTSFTTFDPIKGINPGNGMVLWDHSIGDNSTTEATDLIAPDAATYSTYLDTYNVAQNSWKAHWIVSPFDPTVTGSYSFFLRALDVDTAAEVARTDIIINVVPEPATMGLLALGGLGLLRRRMRRAF